YRVAGRVPRAIPAPVPGRRVPVKTPPAVAAPLRAGPAAWPTARPKLSGRGEPVGCAGVAGRAPGASSARPGYSRAVRPPRRGCGPPGHTTARGPGISPAGGRVPRPGPRAVRPSWTGRRPAPAAAVGVALPFAAA